jgi:toxin ParE1/3/4
MHAMDVLAHNPLIGRPVANASANSLLGRKSHGYVALYQCVDEIDTVFVLALRGQREAGYARSGA